ncbi:PGF-CTERM-anchored ABC transporter substrate-binding protein [Halobacterium jilantaiense]|uniref:Iron complex transport system substrate-binding protein n=1 Tax=Halobacterium jilantaiense TaxID=355548 RepID=A0A1I0MQG9_9EURY|nr:PGF-CTERM-anchored ABC transporter substrate-binding protein [Halobacterium jilantaiense]SEV90031.1 iron complex transport system substrate-binding protein [Halobacterium jilantaiense]
MRRPAIVLGVVLLVLSATVPAAGAFDAPAAQEDPSCEFPVTMTDASDANVTVDAEPERVVTLNPSAAQTMWELDAREKVVGVSQFAGYLEDAGDREVVTSGSPSQVNAEQVISLEPDLVLAPNTIDNDSVTQLRDAGVTVYRFQFANSLDAVYEKTETIGRLVGACDAAETTVSDMRDRVDTIRQAVDGQERPSVYYALGGGYTAGPSTFIGSMIDTAGGHNIAADGNFSKPYPQPSEEFVAEQDPEHVVVGVPAAQMNADKSELIGADSVVRNTTAYEEGNIVAVNVNHINQPAPRVVEPMTQMAQAFHPDAYAEANTTTTATTAEPTTQTETATTAAATTTDGGDGSSGGSAPGFGVATGVVAVLGAALFARR